MVRVVGQLRQVWDRARVITSEHGTLRGRALAQVAVTERLGNESEGFLGACTCGRIGGANDESSLGDREVMVNVRSSQTAHELQDNLGAMEQQVRSGLLANHFTVPIRWNGGPIGE